METTKAGQTFYEAEANFLFPEGCTEGNNSGGECDWCAVYYDGECPECGHLVTRHRDRDGCQVERTISNPMFAEHYDMDVPCGCERLSNFYRPISTHWEALKK